MRQSSGRRRRRQNVLLPVIAAVTFHSGASFAQGAAPPDGAAVVPDARAQCLSNHEQAQLKRIEKKLIAARTAARQCAVTECPAAVRSDCSEWVAELSKLIPTVLLVAESGNGEVENVRVTIDGVLLTEKLDGTAIEVEPGPHTLRFEHAGEPPIDRRVDVPEGEKSLMVRVRFAGPQQPAPVTPVAPAPAPVDTRPREPGDRPIPVLTYLFGGLTLAAAGTSAVVAAGAFSDRSDAQEECAPNCDEERVNSIQNRLVLADVAAGVAIASAGLAVYFYVSRPEVPKESARTGYSPFLGVRKRGSGFEVTAGSAF